ncbi:MAG TPA: AtpZ/AtpI family protein [Bacteroidia bacterium]|nr:AtpZ/AtpI family protein [Bacteroidia bacterium]HRH07052.1 AtpZ/AtpI family protein [Bacteroidia bacterium]HRH61724.1 AtpZ/AtpI family protein [Bacteroidia bacterium]
MPINKSEKKPKKLHNYAKYSGMGLQMAVIMLAGVMGGRYLDRFFTTSFPVFTLILTLAAVAAAIWFFIKDFLHK